MKWVRILPNTKNNGIGDLYQYLYMYIFIYIFAKNLTDKRDNFFFMNIIKKKKNSIKLILQIFQVVSTYIKTNQKVAFPRQQ